MIRAVVFDLDGTLLNRDASVEKFIENQYERLSSWLGHIPKNSYIDRFLELDCHGYVWKDKVYQHLVNEFRMNELMPEWLLADYVENFKNYCVAFENLESMLEELKRQTIKLGIITNGFGSFQMDNIKALGIEEYFDLIFISEWEGTKKPDTLIFKRALEKLGVLAEESIYVGDHPVNDVEGSIAAGMNAIWKENEHYSDYKTKHSVKDLIEVVELVSVINRAILK